MTPDQLRDWQTQMAYTYVTASQALGMSRSGYAKMLLGQAAIDRRTALACAAIAVGVQPWGADQNVRQALSFRAG